MSLPDDVDGFGLDFGVFDGMTADINDFLSEKDGNLTLQFADIDKRILGTSQSDLPEGRNSVTTTLDSALPDQIHRLQQENDSLLSKIRISESALRASDERATAAEARAAAAEVAQATAEARAVSAEVGLAAFERIQQESVDQTGSERAQFEAEIDSLRTELRRERRMRQDASSAVSAVEQAASEVFNEKERVDSLLVSTRTELEASCKRLEVSMSSIRALEATVSELQLERDGLKAELEAAAAELRSAAELTAARNLEAEAEPSDPRIPRLESSLEELRRELDGAVARAEAAETEVSGLSARCVAAEEASLAVSELQDLARATESQLGAQRERADGLSGRLAAAEVRLRDWARVADLLSLEDDPRALEVLAQNWADVRESMTQELEQHVEQITLLERGIEEAKKALDESKNALDESAKQVETLQAELESRPLPSADTADDGIPKAAAAMMVLQAERDELRGLLTRARASLMGDLTPEARAECAAEQAADYIEMLQLQLDEARAAPAAPAPVATATLAEVDDLREQVSSLTGRLQMAETQRNAAEEELIKLSEVPQPAKVLRMNAGPLAEKRALTQRQLSEARDEIIRLKEMVRKMESDRLVQGEMASAHGSQLLTDLKVHKQRVNKLAEQLKQRDRLLDRYRSQFKQQLILFRKRVQDITGWRLDVTSEFVTCHLKATPVFSDSSVRFMPDTDGSLKVLETPLLQRYHSLTTLHLNQGHSIPGLMSALVLAEINQS
eukprot:gnl/Dysnectes_brevis/3522_a4470_385.p1 GENE.gnl/Dysnectes_brevis/3522_a4470_385~~gnl/Dysnectes_brevis/3522_a4470_385.p1  ORF type:complete len:737 (+),score=261.00 gnl/Dysnectes_brevis/3522_a4470_385:51-2261(+)